MQKSIKILALTLLNVVILNYNANAQWVQANTGLTVNDVNSFAVIGTNIFATTGYPGSQTGKGIFKSTDNGSNWAAVNNGLPGLATLKVVALGTDLFVAMQQVSAATGGIFKSTDNGSNWTALIDSTNARNIAVLGTTLYASFRISGNNTVYLSTDNGSTWTESKDAVLKSITVKSIVKIGGNIIAASDGFGGTEGGVFLSTDNGVTWAATSITNGTDDLAIVGTMVFAATGKGVFKSSDNGATWTATTNKSGVIDNATALAVIGTNLIVATPGGRVFSSNDNGTAWTDVSTGASFNLGAEALSKIGTDIFAGVCLKTVGIWKRPLSELNGGAGLPTPPSNLTVVPQKGNKMKLSWTDNSSDELGFIISKSTDDITFNLIDTVLPNITTYTDTGLKASTMYFYKVAAYNGAGNSAYTAITFGMTLAGVNKIVNSPGCINIYPNPSPGQFTLTFTQSLSQPIQLKVTDILGKEVHSETVTRGTNSYFLNLADLSNGVYLLHELNGNVQKLVIKK